jgi:hypothetical protein
VPDIPWRNMATALADRKSRGATASGLDHGIAVRHARDVIRRHVVEFVEKHHHSKPARGESA